MARILLDSNAWRHIVECDEVEDLRRAARWGPNDVLIAPAVVYEALRTSDPKLRSRLAKAMTRTAWVRLLPEAHEECIELLEELRCLRPEWCLTNPDRASYWQQRADWEGNLGFWWRVRTNPHIVADQLARIEGDLLDTARTQAKEMRDVAREFVTFERVDLSSIRAIPLPPLPGWQGGSIEAWRMESLLYYTTTLLSLAREDRSSASWDWLAPWIDVEAIRSHRASWNRLFLYEIRSDRMRRNWLRWAFRVVQATRRTTPGTPGDNQLASYLTDADTVVTADRQFADIVSRVATETAFELARPALVPGDRRRIPEEILAIVAGTTDALRSSKACPVQE